MTKAYLLLLNIIDNEYIYVDHKRQRFEITHYNKKIVINREDVNDFVTIFMTNKEDLLEKLNIKI